MITSHTLCNERRAELEAELANAKEEATTERLSAEEWYLKAQGLEAELATLKGENAGYKDGAQRLIESNTRLLKRAEEAEAKVEHLHEVLEQAEAELADMTRQRDAAVVQADTFKQAWEELEAELAALNVHLSERTQRMHELAAELAALRARRCESCEHSSQTNWGDFCCENGLEMLDFEPFPDNFFCSEWEARP